MKPSSLLRASFAWEPTLFREPGGLPPCQGWGCGAGKGGGHKAWGHEAWGHEAWGPEEEGEVSETSHWALPDGNREGEVMRPQRQAGAELEGFLEEGCFG